MRKVFSPRVLQASQRQRRKGSALLLVVVLVLLLAMMGTAFLMTVRLSREQITGTGSAYIAVPASDYWPPVDPSKLQQAQDEVRALVGNAIQNATLDTVVVPQQYRNPTNAAAYAHDYVATEELAGNPGSGATIGTSNDFLASRIPDFNSGTTVYSWAFLGAFQNRAFTDIINGGRAIPGPTPGAGPLPAGAIGTPYAMTTRKNLQISSVSQTYPTPFPALPALAGRTRIFPALYDGVATHLAADASGSGVADAALFPLNVAPDARVAADGNSHPITYWGAVRVVDNAAALNINTSWRSVDRTAGAVDLTAANPEYAFLGAFRSNVGLYQLLNAMMGTTNATAEFSVFDPARMGTATASLTMVDDNNALRGDASFLTQGDAMENQLARRVLNPGANGSTTTRFHAMPVDASSDLSYHFLLMNPAISSSILRNSLIYTTFGRSDGSTYSIGYSPNYAQDSRKWFSYYGANQFDYWYHTGLNWDDTTRNTFLSSTTNPNSPVAYVNTNVAKTARHLLVQSNAMANSIPDHITDFAVLPAAIKTVTPYTYPDRMPDTATLDTPTRACVNTATFGQLWRAYWNVFRCNINSAQVSRSPIGTWATTDNQILTRAALAAVNTVTMRNPEGNAIETRNFATAGGQQVTVYSVKKQPFITEAMVQQEAASTTASYIAIELYNPYNVTINLQPFHLAYQDASGNLQEIPVAGLSAATMLPNSYKVIAWSATGSAPVAPTTVVVTGTPLDADPTTMQAAIGHKLFLMRTLRDNNTPAPAGNLNNLVPADQVNLGITLLNNPPDAHRWTYSRNTTQNTFYCVYGGDPAVLPADVTSGGSTPIGSLGAANVSPSVTRNLTIPLGNFWNTTTNPALTLAGNKFPFGGFARDGDILHVPFIGGYRVVDGATTTFISPSADSYYAEDNDATTDTVESVGRFVPLKAFDPTFAGTDSYAWATHVFDYLSATQNPQDDRTPNVPNTTNAYPGSPLPANVPNGPITAVASANNGNEDRVGIEGKVNINTASWQVLASLPLVPGDVDASRRLAKGIVRYRDVNDGSTGNPHGPFKNIFELNAVPAYTAATLGESLDSLAFRLALGDPTANPTTFTAAQGLISGDGLVAADFEKRTLELTRISNLVTTRSDSFTAYVLVQAWQDAASQYPVMLSEQRAVFIIDRSGMSRVNPSPQITTVP